MGMSTAIEMAFSMDGRIKKDVSPLSSILRTTSTGIAATTNTWGIVTTTKKDIARATKLVTTMPITVVQGNLPRFTALLALPSIVPIRMIMSLTLALEVILILATILDTVTEFKLARRIRRNMKSLTLPITIAIGMGIMTTVVVLETKSFTNDLIEKDSCAVIRMATVVGDKKP